MDYKLLGKYIRSARVERKWTQEHVADKIGRSTSFVGHIERGSRIVSLETLQLICNVLELSLDELLGCSPVETKKTAIARTLLAKALEMAEELE